MNDCSNTRNSVLFSEIVFGLKTNGKDSYAQITKSFVEIHLPQYQNFATLVVSTISQIPDLGSLTLL